MVFMCRFVVNEMEICRFCLKTKEKSLPIDKMTKEIIGLMMLPLDLHITPEPVMCYGCAETLQMAFDFKSACIYTEDCLYPFIEGKIEARLDLREIYLKVNDSEDVESVEGHVIEENVEMKKLLENYFPEVIMGAIEKPVACENCLTFLRQYSLFITSISNVEQQIQSYSKKNLGRDCVGEVDLRQVRDFSLGNVTKREVEAIGYDKVAKKEVMIFAGIGSVETIIAEGKIECDEKETGASKISMVLSETERREQEEFDSFAGSDERFTLNRIPHIEEVDMKRPFLEPFETEVKGNLMERTLYVLRKSRGKARKAKGWSTASRNRVGLRSPLLQSDSSQKIHPLCKRNKNDTLMLIDPSTIFSGDAEMKPTVVETSYNPEENHTAIERGTDQNTSEMETGNPEYHRVKSVEDVEETVYSCEHCPYKTKSKYYLPIHMLVHKDISEVKAYRCELCPYKSKWKSDLPKHMLIHKDPAEIPTYNCNLCSYTAIRKATLNGHMLVHKDASDVKTSGCKREPEIFQCALCQYKTNRNYNLTKHMRTHCAATYDCNKCSYKTKLMKRLVQHMPIHNDDFKNSSKTDTEDPKEVKSVGDGEETIYHCIFCPYKAKVKYYLTRHMLVHKDISEVTTYQCPLCPHKAKLKYYLKKHMVVHKNISEVAGHQCALCPYKSKRRTDLVKHMRTHEGSSDCSVGSFKAKQEAHLTARVWIHGDILKDAKSAQNQQENMMEHQELEGCSTIKSEEVDIKDEEDECDDESNKL
ncbi:hypothetical protein NQ318_000039 [Aromia moschata]|uniref:C2H2-type domain-containing protein n=1 Tax=Aromia moschata TaxID=1265417 RepID=A0AAV8YD71_9CUCU|nr:hypothetical protein NQ318_000039 [Aromia moschata]